MDSTEQRVKIAVQKSGRLTDHSIDLLERCGLKLTRSKDQLIHYGENMPVDLLLVRDDDIPGLVSRRCLRPRHRGPQCGRGKAPDSRTSRSICAVQTRIRARLRALPAVDCGPGRREYDGIPSR